MPTLCTNHQPGVYHVIMDRKVYQEHTTIIKESAFFPITLYWHLDGASAMKSKSMSLWPIQSFLVELPLNLRYSYKNILLSGLWYGKKKHNMQIFQDLPDLETSADSADKTEPEPAVKSSDEIERSLPAPTPFKCQHFRPLHVVEALDEHIQNLCDCLRPCDQTRCRLTGRTVALPWSGSSMHLQHTARRA